MATDASADKISCRILNKEDLQALSSDPAFSVDPSFLAHAQTDKLQVVGVMVGNDIAGICCFAWNYVPAQLNTGGSRFKGIGLRLPDNSVYLFKVFIKSEYRGKRLTGEMLNFSLQSSEIALNRTLVTTTDIANTSFRRAIERLGFKSVGRATEVIILGKHWFMLPPPIGIHQVDANVRANNLITLEKPRD